jgi:hypothetical protein
MDLNRFLMFKARFNQGRVKAIFPNVTDSRELLL